ncbi:TIR domain-containing protein [Dickeya fangzhongdai]|uniref:TIR domain-containing protein n=1 Tax=Dickeya fangzhongdai TaxID=1778540 RepID=UPI00092D2939|nr:TIR domain-containing protein [Dickeya fangzhongdai]
MAQRNCNYTAFYVEEPFTLSNLGAYQKRDFNYYNMLKAWKAKDSSFPFTDAHDSTYSVRDGSDWEKTLKPRLHERIRNSQNIILFLSSATKNSQALREEINYGVEQGMPIIVIYPEIDIISANEKFTSDVVDLWGKLPALRDSFDKIPTLHIPFTQSSVRAALENTRFFISSKTEPGKYVE